MNEILVAVMAVVIVVGGALAFAHVRCGQQAVSFQDHRWSVFAGCMVKHRDRWLPIENIRGFDDKG